MILLEIAVVLFIISLLIEYLVPYVQRALRRRKSSHTDLPFHDPKPAIQHRRGRPSLGRGAAWTQASHSRRGAVDHDQTDQQ
jgi:hypothetical protein